MQRGPKWISQRGQYFPFVAQNLARFLTHSGMSIGAQEKTPKKHARNITNEIYSRISATLPDCLLSEWTPFVESQDTRVDCF